MPIENSEHIKLNERNDLEAIIGSPPGWTLRWGMSMACGIILLFLFLAWLVRYPDIVNAPAILTTENPPIRLKAKESARLDKLFIENGAEINKNKIIGVLENPADENDVLALENFLEKLKENTPSSYLAIELPGDLKLGTLENSFTLFEKRFSELLYFLKKDINFQKIKNLREQISDLERLNILLENQIDILKKEVNIAYSGYKRDSLLLEKEHVSQVEYENSKSIYLRKKRELENMKSGAVENDLGIRKMEAQILDLQLTQSDDENESLLNFKTELNTLLGEIKIWKNRWLLISPIDGKVVFTNKWSEQQHVEEDEEVCTIVPTGSAGEIIAIAYLTGPNMGKIKPDMPALLRLDAYPYQEYGVLNGILLHIEEAPGQKGYEAFIHLPEKMRTSHHDEISFQQEMAATARIVTEERSFLERVLDKIWATFERN